MLVNPANITEKSYKKLSVKASPNGLSYCSFDTLNNTLLLYGEIAFDAAEKKTVQESYASAFDSNATLRDSYDEVVLLHDNHFAAFVPDALFDEQYLGSYLQYNVKVFENDDFAHDSVASCHMQTVFVPNAEINDFFESRFRGFVTRHVNTTLVCKLLELSRNIDDKKLFVHMGSGHFEIIIVQNQHLLLFNSFEYQMPEDLIYYLLFTAEQLNLNPETLKLEFLGDISEDDAFFAVAYKYIRDVSLMDMSGLQHNNPFTAEENRKHFILFHS